MGGLHPGQMLAGTSYQVVREIGAGGMGVVYEVEHVRLKKRYVTKVIHEQIKNEDGALKRMEREAQVLAGISHPNVVQVHDFGSSADGVAYFVMEKLDGVDLRRFMKKRNVPRWRWIDIMADVLEALDYVHRRGIVHRDIKPENIFLAEQESTQGTKTTITKVLDFGIVSIVDSDGRLSQGRITKTGGFVGTLYYAAPEQMQGKPPGPANDVYAAGLVLFELIAGKGPFDDDPGVGLSRCFKPAPRLTEVSNGTPPELSDVVARALEQEPSARPTAGALAAELRKVGAGLKAMPGADDAVRAEVDDLLAQFGQSSAAQHAPVVRPAAGRDITPAPAPIVDEGTAVPATPLMAGAPGRGGSGGAVFDPTMVSPEEAPPPAVRPAIRAALAPTNVAAAAALPINATPTNIGIGQAMPPQVQTQTQAHPHQLPQQHPTPHPHVAHAMSSPPPSPRLPLAAMQQQQRPLHDSNPGAAPHFSTTPGVYATVDQSAPSSSTPGQRQPPWAGIAMVGGAVILAAMLLVGAFIYQRNRSSAAAAVTVATTPTPATADPTPSASATAATAAPAETSSATPLASASASSAATAAATTTAPPAHDTKPSTTPKPAAAPRPPNSGQRNAEKDGYINHL